MNDHIVGEEVPISHSSERSLGLVCSMNHPASSLTLPPGLSPISLRSHLLFLSISKSAAMETDITHKINPRFSERSSLDLNFSGRALHIFDDVQETELKTWRWLIIIEPLNTESRVYERSLSTSTILLRRSLKKSGHIDVPNGILLLAIYDMAQKRDASRFSS
jgi:hypothetical protein